MPIEDPIKLLGLLLFLLHIFDCQLDEPYGFPGEHQPNAAPIQCQVHSGIYNVFSVPISVYQVRIGIYKVFSVPISVFQVRIGIYQVLSVPIPMLYSVRNRT